MVVSRDQHVSQEDFVSPKPRIRPQLLEENIFLSTPHWTGEGRGDEEMVSCWDGVECCDFLFLQDGEADMQLCSAALEWDCFIKN